MSSSDNHLCNHDQWIMNFIPSTLPVAVQAMPDRKFSQAGSACGGRKKPGSRSKPETARREAIFIRNAYESTILRLPGEIRKRIWAFALGDRLLHVKARFHSNGRHVSDLDGKGEVFDWVSMCCLCPYTEMQLFERSKVPIVELVDRDDRRFGENVDATGKVNFVGTIAERRNSRKFFLEQSPHTRCSSVANDISFGQQLGYHEGCNHEERQKHTLDLRLLRVCRQVYGEANVVLWTSNTFSFTNGGDLKMFLDSCTSVQKTMVRSLSFDAHWFKSTAPAKSDNLAMIKSLVGLRTLSIHILNNAIEYPSFATERSRWQSYVDLFCQGLSQFKILPISSVAVVIQNHPYGLKEQWPFDACIEQAERLREAILDPEGLEKFNAGKNGTRRWLRARRNDLEEYGRWRPYQH